MMKDAVSATRRFVPEKWRLAVFTIICGLAPAVQGENLREYAVEASARAESSPPRIVLGWRGDAKATGYVVWRKGFADNNWSEKASLPASALEYADGDVAPGNSYEYQIRKTRSEGEPAYGYVYAGIEAPLIENRGRLILIVDRNYAGEFAGELDRLKQDLVGDGWTVLRHDVWPTDSIQSVRSLIQADYSADPGNSRAVFLLGHIPVPYSGNIYPDGHPNHLGAWPADVYYGDMDGVWTDSSVNSTAAERQVNWNVPGDGKFDQSMPPSDVELEVGRVDLSNLTNFANKNPSRSERDLVRQYLEKNHRWRFGELPVQRRALVVDHFGLRGSYAVSASGWRNFAPFFGANNVFECAVSNYVATLRQDSYLWTYGSGGGSYYYSAGVAEADEFAIYDLKAVFTLFLGSYYGDWNNESNFLRSSLGSGWILAATYAGFPHIMYHHMGLGLNIGHGIRISQNNATNGLYYPQGQGTRQVHISLLGDPTLRLHPVRPPAGLSAADSSQGVQLSWTVSPEPDLRGYHVYRATSADGPFTRVSAGSPVSGTSFRDTPPAGQYTYMLRAVKLESSGSGTYLNPSQGVFASVTAQGTSTPSAPAAPANLQARSDSPTKVSLSWQDASGNEDGFKIERKTGSTGSFAQIGTAGANTTAYEDITASPSTTYVYRVRAHNSAGDSGFSNEATVRSMDPPPQPPAAPGNLQAAVLSGPEVRLNWNDQSGNESGFAIERKVQTGGAYGEIAQVGSDVTAFTDTGVNVGTEYFYRVRAFNAQGSSAFSNEARAAIPSAPADPVRLSLLSVSGGTVRIRVAGQAGQTFTVEMSRDFGAWSTVATGALVTSTADLEDRNAGSEPRRYYRARLGL